MYNSLALRCADFHLYVIAFDEDCYYALSKLSLTNASIIKLEDFENERLLAVKQNRTAQEYCWTCASSTIKYCIEKYQLDHCSYVDADLLFFNDPQVLYNEMGDKSVLITKHRYTPRFDQTASSGIYCVQYLTIKNTEEGMTVLNWWVDACIEWCYARVEGNKFGDQKYLDDWMQRFTGIHELQHLGGGVAPWNVQQYAFKSGHSKIIGTELLSNEQFDLIFYHYHAFAYSWNDTFRITAAEYTITKNQVKRLYRPYVMALLEAEERVAGLKEDFLPYKRIEDGKGIGEVIGRSIVFFIRGFYKHFYSKRFFQYGIFN